MKNRHAKAFISSSLSIAPMIAIVIVLSLTGLSPLPSGKDYLFLIIGMIVLIFGLALFQIGASQSLTQVGEYMGSSLSKQSNLFIVVLFAFSLGALITCAEPSILIVSKQVQIPATILIGAIAIGIGVFVVVGILRIIFHGSLKVWYLLFYALTFMLIVLISMNPEKSQFLPFIFDSGGVTTGSATVPFILALGAGVAAVRGGRNATNDSFGLVGMASIGPIMTMTLLILFSNNNTNYVPQYVDLGDIDNIFTQFVRALLPYSGSNGSVIDVLIALSPILVIFFIYNLLFIKLPRAKILKLLVGFAFSFVGLSLFLSATNAVMTPVGNYVGKQLGAQPNVIIILVAFVIGLVTILCEPAVHVLTSQMETISDGNIKKPVVLLTLSLGVGVAIALAAIRSIFDFSIMYYMIPGYAISLILMFFCPDIYSAMAFDSGGTASGPMSTSFVLPMIVGLTTVMGVKTSVYEQAFGVVALIALTPVIAIQILGVIENAKRAKIFVIMRRHTYTEDDAQIIHFN